MSSINELHEIGQSLWYDNIERKLLENGTLQRLVDLGEIRGITSNPSIFQNAIARSTDYDAALKAMAWSGWTPEEIFYQLAIEDIRAAADMFRPVYDQTDGGDGYVSIEVSPHLANDTEGTLEEVKRLWQWVDRPNLMVKIPATKEGVSAIRQAIAAGVNVNVTLIFSLTRYMEVMDAFLSGLEERLASGQDISRIASVASFFVSRVDTKVDDRLNRIIEAELEKAETAVKLQGKAAIANARLAYAEFLKVFSSPRFQRLAEKGARKQRPLWASTSTKNPAYRDVIYVEELIGPDTVNTVPPKTLDAFRDHGKAEVKLGPDVAEDEEVLRQLNDLNISMDEVTYELEVEGVKAFSDAFNSLLNTIAERSEAARKELGPLKDVVPARVKQLEEKNAARRLQEGDAALWTDRTDQHKEIRERLGWLNLPQKSRELIPVTEALRSEVHQAGLTHALLLGMGGSSLAPEVFREVFGLVERNGIPPLDLAVLDSTDPEQVEDFARRAPVEKTLFIVSSKSGTTGEVKALFDYFWAKARQAVGERAGEHFIAITDPGTPLEKLGRERGFRRVILADPTVGGRFSALTAFGLVPSALIGLDIERLLDRAQWMADQCRDEVPAGRNPGLVLGAVLGEAALSGRDKLTVISDTPTRSFGAWLEQLVAKSSGKDGRGIVPVDLEPQAHEYGSDRMFVYLNSSGESLSLAQDLREKGHPVIELLARDLYDVGTGFFRWEYGTSIACAVLGVNTFNQPDVQDTKTRTREFIQSLKQTGTLNEGDPIWEKDGIRAYGQAFPGLETAGSLRELVSAFLKQVKAGGYVAINAYLPRSEATQSALQELRKKILAQTGAATTLGFGPRFLHSTGQLHKGGPDIGVFLVITRDPAADVEIPEQGLRFGQLLRAQALGDMEALQERGRRVLRVHLPDGGLEALL